MAEEQDTRVGGFSLNKFIIAILIFVALGFIIEMVVGYTQRNTTQTVLQERAVVGDETNQLTKENNEMLKQLVEKINNLENKLNSLENAGKPAR